MQMNPIINFAKSVVIFLGLFTSFLFPSPLQADDGRAVMRTCRRGTPKAKSLLTRSAINDRKPGGDFYTGDRRQLVVLAAFRDKDFDGGASTALQHWQQVMNAEQYEEGSFVGSVHDYFLAQSYGRFRLTFDIVYLQLPDSCRRYRSTESDDEFSQYMVNDIVDMLMVRQIDWSQYDWNGNGQVNQLLIIFAGKGMNDGGDSNTIWPHQWWLSEHVNPETHKYLEARTVTYEDRQYQIDCYCAVPEKSGSSAYSTFGTICHEYTHCFGFPDFYYGNFQYVGKWDLMDYGNYNGYGYCPAGYSAHERWLMGWLTPTELSGPVSISQMAALSDEPEAYIIRNDAYPDECYIIENRQQRSWDAKLPGSGLIVFHIDYDASLWSSVTDYVNQPSVKRYHILPANNQPDYKKAAGWAYPYQTNDSLTNTSKPAATLSHKNLDGTMLLSAPITRMAVEGGMASFLFMGGDATAVRQPVYDGIDETLYRLGHLRIVRTADGTIRKVIVH